MLSLHALKSASEAGKYYQQDNYYTSGDDARQTSQWHGKGAKLLGLSGHVTEKDFEEILSGNLPNGARLGRMQDGKRIHRPGLDMTFSAPKSVSILAEVGGDKRLLKAHEESVKAVLDIIEKKYSYTRVKDETGKVVKEQVDNLVIATFEHKLSRERDPQSHTHCVAANATQRDDGNWRSLEMVDVFNNKLLLGTMYRSILAKKVTQLGYNITRTGKNCMFEIEQVPIEVRECFSKRRGQIKDMLNNFNEQGGKAASVAALITRARKKSISHEELTELWQQQTDLLNFDAKAVVANAQEVAKQQGAEGIEQQTSSKGSDLSFDIAKLDQQVADTAQSHAEKELPSDELKEIDDKLKDGGLDTEEKADLLQRAITTVRSIWQRTHNAFAGIYPALSQALSGQDPSHDLDGLTLAIEHLSERNSRFTNGSIRLAGAEFGLGQQDMLDIDNAIAERVENGELLSGYTEDGGFYYTTPELRRTEEENLEMLDKSKQTVRPIMSKKEIAQSLVNTTVNKGQQACIILALNTKDRVIGIQGHAGAGKTFMMKEAKRLLNGKGYEFIGMAPSASAARTLQKDTAIESQTISRFLAVHDNFIRGNQPNKDVNKEMYKKVLLVDEASLASSEQFNKLLKFSELTGTRLIFMGDIKQLGSVEAGCPFSQLLKHGMRVAEMTNIVRQKCSQLREAVYKVIAGIDSMKEGPFAKAIDSLENNIKDTGDTLADTVQTWKQLSPKERADTLIIAPSNRLRKNINIGIRRVLAGEGVIKKDKQVSFTAYENKSLTVAELKHFHNYVPGNTLIFAKGYAKHGFRPHEGFRVIEVNTKAKTVTLKNEAGRQVTIEPGRIPEKNLKEAGLYEDLPLRLAEGDQLRWTRNSKNDREIINGHKITVMAVNTNMITIKQEDGTIKELDMRNPDLKHIDYAFCSTVHAAQGQTKEGVIAALDSNHKHLTNQRLFYVSISRAKNNLHIFNEDRNQLVTNLSRNTGAKTASLDIKHDDMGL
jgi:conjugative relaxase-like TrwC/TraI family protein